MFGSTIFKLSFLIVKCNFSNGEIILTPNFLLRGSIKIGLSLNSKVSLVLFSLFLFLRISQHLLFLQQILMEISLISIFDFNLYFDK